MLFTSYAFLFVFLPVLLLGFALCMRWASRTASMLYLIGASLVFYGWWNWRYVFLILTSMAFNYGWAAFLQRRAAQGGSRMALAVGIAVNLGALGYFKYANFLVDTLDAATGWGWQIRHIALPLAISFFTFEQITYLVDAARGEAPAHDWLSYGVFITFFPRLIAGPIVRPRQILPQLASARPFVLDADGAATGLLIFAIGLFKKVVIADTFSPFVAPIFEQAHVVPFVDAWGATLAFALQLYFDFSGYCDMAVGLARLFGIVLPENFDSPYQAHSIIEFWRRWHMTLTSFLRDYLYIPLGGNRLGALREHVNLLVTMLLAGLWHGASWMFVIWGALHAAYVSINHLWRQSGARLPAPLAWMLTFVAVLVGWVFFRAPSLDRARVVLAGMAGLSGFAGDGGSYAFGAHEWKRLLPALALVLWCPNRQAVMTWRWDSDLAYAGAFAVLASISILRLGDPAPFWYFQF